MYSKKVVFSLFTVPPLGKLPTFSIIFIVFMQQAHEYQRRRALDKEHEGARR